MPELPEVESYRRYFDQTAHRQTVKKVEIIDTKVVKMAPEVLRQTVEGQVLGQSDRIGKYMFVHLGQGGVLMFHFGMTGSLEYVADQAELPRFTRVRFWLANGFSLAFVDPRKFGRIELGASVAEFQERKALSTDALTISLAEFAAHLRRRRSPIKSVLLDQGVAAGVGNWIADEILFQAMVDPWQPAAELSAEKVALMHQKMGSILQIAVAQEAYYRDFPPSFLIHSRGWTDRRIAPCPNCGGEIAHQYLGGRATYYCSTCLSPSLRSSSSSSK